MRDGKLIGFVAGVFDLCHAGHMLMLEEARGLCDHLIVALHADPSVEHRSKKRPVMSLAEREIILRGIKYVDEVVTYRTERELLALLQVGDIDVRILGNEYRDKSFTGSDMSITLYFTGRDHGLSSTQLRRRVFAAEYGEQPVMA